MEAAGVGDAVEDGRQRVIIRGVSPEVECGRFPAKRTVGERVIVEADVFTDGHDEIACVVLHRRADTTTWDAAPMSPLVNDRFAGEFTVTELGRYSYTIQAWVDHFSTWRHGLEKKVAAGQDVSVDLLAGVEFVERAGANAAGADARRLAAFADRLRSDAPLEERVSVALDDELALLVRQHDERRHATTYGRELEVVVDRERARFSTWYELFPRSAAAEPGRHGTFADVEARLPYVAAMGFDILYLPPIHPIGWTKRKGPNNATLAAPDDVGSPWAIGSHEGGHKDIHPDLGTLEDFRHLVSAAREVGIEVALDIAFQCSPDHPYVKEHPEWFRSRPDGTVQYAENPPKKYEDIYPFDFETDDWQALWEELKSVFEHWIAQGVQVFRVDNPHTKPFPFWEWAIGELKREHPETIFLAEAFTRPKVMAKLAELGFTQSYTYFAWRNHKWEIQEYFTEITTEMVDYFRPNAWPNTPDILTERLQYGGRPAFVSRLVLAATLSANYGIYGPAFELMEHVAREPGSEEYLDSEKYQLRQWQLDQKGSLRPIIARMNRVRRENPALQQDRTLRFHSIDNPELLCYSKVSEDGTNVILMIVNLDPHWKQSGWTALDLSVLGLDPDQSFQVHDLLGDSRYVFNGAHNYVELDPNVVPAHVFLVRRHLRTERDFAYYM